MYNLIVNIKKIMKFYNKTVEDIDWVGNAEGTLVNDWEFFKEHCNINYDNWDGPGTPYDIVVVFKDGSWLERDCDMESMNEFWCYRKPPTESAISSPFQFEKCVDDDYGVFYDWKEI